MMRPTFKFDTRKPRSLLHQTLFLMVVQIVVFPVGIAWLVIAGLFAGFVLGTTLPVVIFLVWLVSVVLVALCLPSTDLLTPSEREALDATKSAPEHPKVPYLP